MTASDVREKEAAKNARKGTKGFVRRPLEERFWEKVNKTESCWIWTGTANKLGYGSIWANGRSRRATQVSWELKNKKPFPSGLHACHACDNPPCVNPDHIWPGTHRENAMDAILKGRYNPATSIGKKPWNADITHCRHGHPLSGENVIINSAGHRVCRTCKKRYDLKYADAHRDRISENGKRRRAKAREALAGWRKNAKL